VVWEAFVEETKVVRVAVNWFMGEENLDPPQHAQNEDPKASAAVR
jgi:hypothetical protein